MATPHTTHERDPRPTIRRPPKTAVEEKAEQLPVEETDSQPPLGENNTQVPVDDDPSQLHISATLRAFIKAEAQKPPPTVFRGPRDKYGFFRTMATGTPAEIAHTLAAASHDRQFLRSIPPTTWNELLRHFSPDRWLARPAEYLQGMIPSFKGPDRSRVDALRDAMSTVVRIRRSAGVAITLAEYKVLLEHSRMLKDTRMSQSLLQDMQAERVTPDIDCWNSFVYTILNDESQRVQVLELPAKKKSNLKTWKPGVVADVVEVVRRLSDSPGVQPNVLTYCAYIRALARAGDFGTISALLEDTWGLAAQDDSLEWTPPPEKDYPYQHRLRPDNRLLRTVAEVYGAQNELGTAFSLVDRVCSHYGIVLDKAVWRELLLWTWVQARRKSIAVRTRNRQIEAKRKAAAGSQFFDPADVAGTEETPSDALRTFSNLLDSFRSQTQGKQRTPLGVLNMEFHNQLGQRVAGTPAHVRPVRRGDRIHAELSRAYDSARHIAETMLARETGAARGNAGAVPPVTTAAREGAKLGTRRIERMVAAAFVQRWARETVEQGVPGSYVADAPPDERARLFDWRVRGIPSFVAQYLRFLPDSLRYQVPGGIVRLVTQPYAPH